MYSKRLKNLREETINFIRQKEIAELLGIHVSNYSQYEGEANIIPLKHLNQICNYFNISLDYIFGFTTQRNYANINQSINLDKLGKRIKNLRLNNNLTQENFAKEINVKQSTVSKCENKKKILSTKHLYAVCKKYNISADYLLGKIDYPNYLK